MLPRPDDRHRSFGAPEGDHAAAPRRPRRNRRAAIRRPRRPRAGKTPSPQELPRRRGLHPRERARRPLEEELSAEAAGAGTQVDDVVRRLDRLGIVLDHDDRVSAVREAPQDREEPPRVHCVQADRGLVENVESPGQRAAERGGEADPLGLSPGKRSRGARERQVLEPDVVHVPDAGTDLRHDRAQPILFGGIERQLVEPLLQVPEREIHQIGDRAPAEPDPQRRRAQAGAPAVGAQAIGAISREQDADVDLVALRLEPLEETVDAVELAPSFDQDFALVRGEPLDRHVRADRIPPARAEEIVVGGLVGRRVPGRDRTLVQPQARVGNHFLQIHSDHAPEALAGRARPERRVEGEERGRRIAELAAALRAVQAPAERPSAVIRAGEQRPRHRERRLRLVAVDREEGVAVQERGTVFSRHRSARAGGEGSGATRPDRDQLLRQPLGGSR